MSPITETIGAWAGIAQATFTVIAVILGGIFAWRRGFLFRYGQPHITIAHDITHRPVSDSYVHIEITAILRNTSRVKVEIRDGLFTIQQLAPATDDYVEALYGQAFVGQPIYKDMKWVLIDDIRLEWEPDALMVEPGQSIAVNLEYIVPRGIQSVTLTTFFCNVRVMGKIDSAVGPHDATRKKHLWLWERKGPRGWNHITTYDIIAPGRMVEPPAYRETPAPYRE